MCRPHSAGDADLECRPVPVAQRRHVVARVANGTRLLQREGEIERLAELCFISRGHEHHAGEAAQVGDVQETMVNRSVAAHQPGAVDAKDHGQALKRHFLKNLIKGPLKKSGIDRADRLHACLGHTCCQGRRVDDLRVHAVHGEQFSGVEGG